MQITGDLNDEYEIMSMISRHANVRPVTRTSSRYSRLFTIYMKNPSGWKLCNWNAKISIGKSRS